MTDAQLLTPSPGYAFSEDGEYLAYGTSASGSDWVEMRFLRVEGAVPLDDRLLRVKFSCMSWTHDGKGLFYNSYPEQEGKSDGEAPPTTTTTPAPPCLPHTVSHDLIITLFSTVLLKLILELCDI